jgi:ferritin-like metal-binding protein YciE
MAAPSIADEKLIQYLNEAYGLEQRLETALQAHIAMAAHPPYKKRLREHLTETKRHGREVAKRIKQLGGQATTVDAPGPAPVAEAAQAVLGGAQKAIALAQGPLHAIRGTGEAEKQLKNAKTEYSDEAEEIATYSAIEALAASVGDDATVKLARAIRREEERMLAYLAKEVPRFARAVAKAEIPASLRNAGASAKRSSAKRTAKRAAGRTTAARAAGAKARSTKTSVKGATATAKARASRAPAKARTRAKATAGAKGAGSR